MKCKNCLAQIEDNALFCYKCGTKQDIPSIDEQIESVEKKLEITNRVFSDKGRIDCTQWLKEFGFEEVCEAVEISIKQYLRFDSDNNPTETSVIEVFSKIPGICANRKISKEKPYIADSKKMFYYACKKIHLSDYQEREYKEYIERVLYLYSKCEDYTEKFEELFWELKKASDKFDFLDLLKDIAD